MNIEFDDSTVNVDDIIKKMKQELKKRNIQENIDEIKLNTIQSVNSTSLNLEVEKNLELANLTWNIPLELQITSHRRFIGGFIVFGKKTVRKFLRWYINPTIASQNEFNANATRTMNAMYQQLQVYEAKIEGLKQEIDSLRSKK